MHDRLRPWAWLRALFAALCTIAIALALGAVWMALILKLPSAHWWFAVPAGVALGCVARGWITPHRYWGTVLAVAGMALTAVYMQCLYVGINLAAVLGLGLLDTLQQAGVVMVLALARHAVRAPFLIATLVAMALAGALAWRRGARNHLTPI